MSMITLTPKALRRAADLKERIDALQDELNELLGNEVGYPVAAIEGPKNGRRKKHKMSAAGRAAIAAAARARWAKIKGTASAAKPVKAGRRKMSAAGRAAIAAAARARWAKAKAAGKTRL
jgi:hypothetical protein